MTRPMTRAERFSDITREDVGPKTYFSFRSGAAVYNEVFEGGALHSLGWELAAFTSAVPVRPTLDDRVGTEAFRLEVGGESLIDGWELDGWDEGHGSAGTATATLTLVHARRGLRVSVVTETTGHGVIKRQLELENLHPSSPAPVAAASPWSGLLWAPPEGVDEGAGGSSAPAVELGYMADSRWGTEGSFAWTELGESETRVSGRVGRGPWRQPFFLARSAGVCFVGQLAWSGGYTLSFDYERYSASGPQERKPWLRFDLAMDAPAPQIVLAPGEVTRTAAAYLGGSADGADAAVWEMIEAERVLDLNRPDGTAGTIQTGIGPEQEITSEAVRHELGWAAPLKPDIFFIDANWYSGPGEDWYRTVGEWNSGTRFDHPVSDFGDEARAQGIRFGLWMEPERIGVDSPAYTRLADLLARRLDGSIAGGVIDLSRDDAVAHVEAEIERVITENRLDFFRIDYNIGYVAEGAFAERHGYRESIMWRYYVNLYAMFRRLRERHPQVIFQNCAGGGGRSDLGMVAQFDDTWVTDWQLAPRSFRIINGMTMALPPEFIDRHTGMGQNDHLSGSLDFQLDIALFGRPSVSWLAPRPAAVSPLLRARVERMLAVYREHIQPRGQRTRIHHHTPVPDGDWGVLERSAVDGGMSIVGAFRLARTGDDETIRVHPRGLDPSRDYRVSIDGHAASGLVPGFALQNDGIVFRLPGALTSSVAVLVAEDV
jgi:alpha-galactosidase